MEIIETRVQEPQTRHGFIAAPLPLKRHFYAPGKARINCHTSRKGSRENYRLQSASLLLSRSLCTYGETPRGRGSVHRLNMDEEVDIAIGEEGAEQAEVTHRPDKEDWTLYEEIVLEDQFCKWRTATKGIERSSRDQTAG